jgi:hypothetical protein
MGAIQAKLDAVETSETFESLGLGVLFDVPIDATLLSPLGRIVVRRSQEQKSTFAEFFSSARASLKKYERVTVEEPAIDDTVSDEERLAIIKVGAAYATSMCDIVIETSDTPHMTIRVVPDHPRPALAIGVPS